jgi:hypothetical protein
MVAKQRKPKSETSTQSNRFRLVCTALDGTDSRNLEYIITDSVRKLVRRIIVENLPGDRHG